MRSPLPVPPTRARSALTWTALPPLPIACTSDDVTNVTGCYTFSFPSSPALIPSPFVASSLSRFVAPPMHQMQRHATLFQFHHPQVEQMKPNETLFQIHSPPHPVASAPCGLYHVPAQSNTAGLTKG